MNDKNDASGFVAPEPIPPSKEVQGEQAHIAGLLDARIRYLKRQQELLGPSPLLEEESSEDFVKRIVRYCIAQELVISAQNTILVSIGLI